MEFNEVSELQKEWRAIVLDKLNTLESGQKEFKADILDIKTTFVNQKALETLREVDRKEIAILRDKVEKLDYFKAKIVGMAIVLQFLIGIAIRYLLK